MAQRTAVVVGGGIGGLAAAVALLGRGWHVEVFERAPEFAEVGAGLTIWSNGLAALDALGVGEQVRQKAVVETDGGIRAISGRWLSRTDTEALARRYGPIVVIHRAHLLDILRRAIPEPALHVATEVRELQPDADHVDVRHAAGVFRADLAIAADGLNSTVRTALWPGSAAPRYAGYTCWRLIADTGTRLRWGGETWGRGERVGLTPMPDGSMYMFCVANAPRGQRNPQGELPELRRRFGTWHDPIPLVLSSATESAVVRHDIYDLPKLDSYVRGRVALLGDAAHAMTPNLGQGANVALEDAVTLAALLDSQPSIEEALAAYDKARRPRATGIIRQSRAIGILAQLRSPAPAAARNLLLRLSPSRAMLLSLRRALTWQPPV